MINNCRPHHPIHHTFILWMVWFWNGYEIIFCILCATKNVLNCLRLNWQKRCVNIKSEFNTWTKVTPHFLKELFFIGYILCAICRYSTLYFLCTLTLYLILLLNKNVILRFHFGESTNMQLSFFTICSYNENKSCGISEIYECTPHLLRLWAHWPWCKTNRNPLESEQTAWVWYFRPFHLTW